MRSYSTFLARAALVLVVLAATTATAGAQFRTRPMMRPGFAPQPFASPLTGSFGYQTAYNNRMAFYNRAIYGNPLYNPSLAYSPFYPSPYQGMYPLGSYYPSYYPMGMYSPSPYMGSYSPSTYSSGYMPAYGGAGTPYAPGSTPPPYQAKPKEEPDTVAMYDNFFKPEQITVSVGTTVKWTNVGKHRHTVTADSGAWGSGDLVPGDSFSHVFTGPGRYIYHCAHHRGEMRGLVIVK